MDQSIRLRRPDEKLPERTAMNIVSVTGCAHAIPLDLGDRRFLAVDASTSTAADDEQSDGA